MISNRRFALAVLGFVAAGVVGSALVVAAAPGLVVATAGGMTVHANSMTFTSMTAYPTVNQTSTDSRRLLVTIEVKSATADSLTLTKTLNLSRYGDVPSNGRVRIRLHSDSVGPIGNSIFRVSRLHADTYDLTDFTVDEGYVDETTQNPAGPSDPVELLTTGQSGSFGNVTMHVHSMALQKLALSNFSIQFQFDPDGDGVYEYK
ncbi:MAG: hypothetical protein ABEJ31_13220 [Haloarculaceae archaeon]